jgi:hypothetical protein
MEKYGWDRYRKEGLQELRQIKESPLFGNKNAQKSFLEIYYQIYHDEKEDQIKATVFYPESISNIVAQHRARTVIKDLRKSIDKFYASPEGKDAKFEIYFIAESGDYKLGIRPKKTNAQLFCPEETVSYNEHQYFIIRHRPAAMNRLRCLLLLIAPLLFLISLVILYVERFHSSWLIFFVGLSGVILSLGMAYIVIVLFKFNSRELVHLSSKYFLKDAIDHIALVSYSAKCPVVGCAGNVFISDEYDERVEDSGYVAKCSRDPKGHKFSIDARTLKGKRIKAKTRFPLMNIFR